MSNKEEVKINGVFKKHSKPFINATRDMRLKNSPQKPMFLSELFIVGEDDKKVMGLKNEEIQDISVVSFRLKREARKRKKRNVRLKEKALRNDEGSSSNKSNKKL